MILCNNVYPDCYLAFERTESVEEFGKLLRLLEASFQQNKNSIISTLS